MKKNNLIRILSPISLIITVALLMYFYSQFRKGLIEKNEAIYSSCIVGSVSLFLDLVFSAIAEECWAGGVRISKERHPFLYYVLMSSVAVACLVLLGGSFYYMWIG